ncbi:MAG: efflux RND transporter permease subunit, partial [Treponema sp.]|nr:efflux RND transporter permease subunit [Treponema sp.]
DYYSRLRPILMSTLTTVISLAPMAFFPAEGSEMMQPISLTVFGGMTFGSLMTLFLMPSIYFIVNKHRLNKARRKEARRKARELKAEQASKRRLGSLAAVEVLDGN